MKHTFYISEVAWNNLRDDGEELGYVWAGSARGVSAYITALAHHPREIWTSPLDSDHSLVNHEKRGRVMHLSEWTGDALIALGHKHDIQPRRLSHTRLAYIAAVIEAIGQRVLSPKITIENEPDKDLDRQLEDYNKGNYYSKGPLDE